MHNNKKTPIHLATNSDQSPAHNYSVSHAQELLADASSQLAFLSSVFSGSEVKELSEIEQRGLSLFVDQVRDTVNQAERDLKQTE